MMLAKPRAARRNLVLGVRELTAQAHRLVFGRAHPAERQVHAAECGLALDETEGLRNGEFEGEPKKFVEHAGARLARIILDRDEAERAAIARPRTSKSGVYGKSVSVRVAIGGVRNIKKKKKN